jgi:acetolactate synthase-1/2/3 large subunit
VKLAEAYGAEGYRVLDRADLEPTLKAALATPHTAIVDVHISREENVYPMIPSGASLEEMLLI